MAIMAFWHFALIDKTFNWYSIGATLISHDCENSTDVGQCKDAGCYSQSITYNATMKQITALIQESTHCRQFIQV